MWDAEQGIAGLRTMLQRFPVGWKSPHVECSDSAATPGLLGMAQIGPQGPPVHPPVIWDTESGLTRLTAMFQSFPVGWQLPRTPLAHKAECRRLGATWEPLGIAQIGLKTNFRNDSHHSRHEIFPEIENRIKNNSIENFLGQKGKIL